MEDYEEFIETILMDIAEGGFMDWRFLFKETGNFGIDITNAIDEARSTFDSVTINTLIASVYELAVRDVANELEVEMEPDEDYSMDINSMVSSLSVGEEYVTDRSELVDAIRELKGVGE